MASRLFALDGAEVVEVDAEAGGSRTVWVRPAAPQAFAARADPVLEQPPSLVAHLGIDEHRRGRPRWLTDEGTGEYVLLADRWHTCFLDLSGDQRLPGQPISRAVTGVTSLLGKVLEKYVPAAGELDG
jgi:hypothetical protein